MGGASRLRVSELECHYGDCAGLDCTHGCFKAVNNECHKELDESEMFLPQLDFSAPVNSVCKKCVGAIEISNKISLRKSSAKTSLKDLEVSDVIAREETLGRRVFVNPNSRGGRYRCIN